MKTKEKNDNSTIIQSEINASHQQPKINNNRTLLVGPKVSTKPYLMLKFLSRIPNRDNYIITKSPPEQHSNSKIKSKQIFQKTRSLSEYEIEIKVFDDILGSTNSKYKD